jgi:uncharacterized membrane protein
MTATASPVRAAPALTESTERSFAIALIVGYLLCFALLPVEIDTAFGLPAHPLLLHVPVILIPLLVIATIAVVVRPAWRERYGFAWAGLAVVALASTVLAAGAGDKFIESKRVVSQTLSEHKEAGETLRLVMFVFTAAILLAVLRDWRARHSSRPIGGSAAAAALSVVIILLAGVSGFFVIRAGHLGSKSVWSEGKEAGEGGGGPPPDGD